MQSLCPPVEMEAPANLSVSLRDAGGDEVGHSTLLSWTYPAPEVLREGWITLVYELQYRRVGEDDNWKVRGRVSRSLLLLKPTVPCRKELWTVGSASWCF